MTCKEYKELNVVEQYQLIGKAVHLLQNNSQAFISISSMVRMAESNGLLDGVTILPFQNEPAANPADLKELI